MPDSRVLRNLTMAGVNDTQPNVNPLTNAITEEQSVTWTFKKRRQHRDNRKHGKPGFTGRMHCLFSWRFHRLARCRGKFVCLRRKLVMLNNVLTTCGAHPRL